MCRAKQEEAERIAAAEQQADQQLMEAAMRKDAQEEAADKQAKAERKAEQLRYRSSSTYPPPGCRHMLACAVCCSVHPRMLSSLPCCFSFLKDFQIQIVPHIH